MNAYQVQEKDGEYAMLVFAPTAKKARVISFGTGWHEPYAGDWIFWQARRIKNLPAHLKELDTGEEQVIDNPPCCLGCDRWGGEPVPYTDTCLYCYDAYNYDPNPFLASSTVGDVTISVASDAAFPPQDKRLSDRRTG